MMGTLESTVSERETFPALVVHHRGHKARLLPITRSFRPGCMSPLTRDLARDFKLSQYTYIHTVFIPTDRGASKPHACFRT
jgi:hypothetical protein